MGCDIHEKIFLRSKTDGEYIEVLPKYNWKTGTNIPDKRFGIDICGVGTDRSYQFFGIMGNGSRDNTFERGDFLVEGVPEFFRVVHGDILDNVDFYGFSYTTFDAMYDGLRRYRDRLKEQLGEDCWTVRGYGRFRYSPKYGRYKRDQTAMIDYITSKLRLMRNTAKNMKSEMFRMKCDLMGHGFDVNDIVYVYYFDN